MRKLLLAALLASAHASTLLLRTPTNDVLAVPAAADAAALKAWALEHNLPRAGRFAKAAARGVATIQKGKLCAMDRQS